NQQRTTHFTYTTLFRSRKFGIKIILIFKIFIVMAFELPKLPYAFDALEPHIDARTMEIHYTKHHQAYTTNLNAAIEGTDLAGKSDRKSTRLNSSHVKIS